MDFDAVIERRGYFIGFETKSPGKAIPTGQRLTIEAYPCVQDAGYGFLVEGKCFDSVQRITICRGTIEDGQVIEPAAPIACNSRCVGPSCISPGATRIRLQPSG